MMLEMDHVTFVYAGATDAAIVDKSIKINRGSVTRIRGNNGSGKSSILMALSGVIPYLINGQFRGRVKWLDTIIREEHLPQLSAFVFQNPLYYFNGATVEDELSELVIPDFVASLLPRVESARQINRLSSGEQQRLAVVSAFSRPNPLVFLDEPFEFLDRNSREILINILRDRSNRGDKTVVLTDGSGNRNVGLNESCVDMEVELSDTNSGMRPVQDIRLPDLQSGSAELLEGRNLSVRFKSASNSLFEGFSFSLKEGEVLGIVGDNGSGKTTLLMGLAGLRPFQSGNICLRGKHTNRKMMRAFSKLVFANPEYQIFGTTVKEELVFGLRNLGIPDSEISQRINKIESYLPAPLSADPMALSFGQKKMLSLICALVLEPSILLLDEPSASLDQRHLSLLKEIIRNRILKRKSVVIASNDKEFMDSTCHKTISLCKNDEFHPGS